MSAPPAARATAPAPAPCRDCTAALQPVRPHRRPCSHAHTLSLHFFLPPCLTALPPLPSRFSQGFCCTCADYSRTALQRAPLTCGLLVRDTQSAHCLRWDDEWWHAVSECGAAVGCFQAAAMPSCRRRLLHGPPPPPTAPLLPPYRQGFQIGEYALRFNIRLNVTTTTQPPANSTATGGGTGSAPAAPTNTTEVLTISPGRPFQRDASRRVSARLLGDLESYQQPAQLDGKWLLIPFALGARQQGEAGHGSRRWAWVVLQCVALLQWGAPVLAGRALPLCIGGRAMQRWVRCAALTWHITTH